MKEDGIEYERDGGIEGGNNSLAAHAIALVLEQYRWYRNA